MSYYVYCGLSSCFSSFHGAAYAFDAVTFFFFSSSVLPSGEIPYEIMIYADMCNTTSFSNVSDFLQVSLRFWVDLLDFDRHLATDLASFIWTRLCSSSLRVIYMHSILVQCPLIGSLQSFL